MGRKRKFDVMPYETVDNFGFRYYRGIIDELTSLTKKSRADSIRDAVDFYIDYLCDERDREAKDPRPVVTFDEEK